MYLPLSTVLLENINQYDLPYVTGTRITNSIKSFQAVLSQGTNPFHALLSLSLSAYFTPPVQTELGTGKR
jgi:hypothetical protein